MHFCFLLPSSMLLLLYVYVSIPPIMSHPSLSPVYVSLCSILLTLSVSSLSISPNILSYLTLPRKERLPHTHPTFAFEHFCFLGKLLLARTLGEKNETHGLGETGWAGSHLWWWWCLKKRHACMDQDHGRALAACHPPGGGWGRGRKKTCLLPSSSHLFTSSLLYRDDVNKMKMMIISHINLSLSPPLPGRRGWDDDGGDSSCTACMPFSHTFPAPAPLPAAFCLFAFLLPSLLTHAAWHACLSTHSPHAFSHTTFCLLHILHTPLTCSYLPPSYP